MADIAIPAIVAAPGSGEATEQWSLWQKIGFRLVCSYFTLYCLPGPFTSIPGGQIVAMPFEEMWHAICPWVAIHVFHLSGQATTYFSTGSGDTTLDYLHNLLVALIAVLATAIWCVLDCERANYRALHAWLRLLVRYTLAFALLGYGFVKVFPLQFQPPNGSRLVEQYGQFSPMGVLWSFMGASIPYIIFAGAAEVTGGLLMLLRRTATLGALVSCGVLANVVALNFCYDVPVKLYSLNLLAMAVFLAAGDAKRLVNVLVLNRPTAPADLSEPRFERHSMRTAVRVIWIAFVGYQLVIEIGSGWERYQQAYLAPPRPFLRGVYDVESFRAGGKDVPPLVMDGTRWRSVEFEPQFVSVQTANDSRRGYRADYAPSTNKITLNGRETLTWSKPDSTHIMLEGSVDGSTVSIGLHHVEFPLMSRGFHWISEFPFNR